MHRSRTESHRRYTAAPCTPRHTRTTRCQPSRGHRRRRRSFHGQADDILTANQNETQTTLFGAFLQERSLGPELTKLLGFAQDEVQVLVKGQEGPDNVPSVVQGDTQPMFDVAQEFAAFSARLQRERR